MGYGYFKQQGGRWVQQGETYEKRAVAVAVYQDKLIWEGGEIRKTSAAHKASVDPRPAICKPCGKHLHGSCEHGSCGCGCKAFWPVDAQPALTTQSELGLEVKV
jgi:hypothetical protein